MDRMQTDQIHRNHIGEFDPADDVRELCTFVRTAEVGFAAESTVGIRSCVNSPGRRSEDVTSRESEENP
jgi:hypothetical protein